MIYTDIKVIVLDFDGVIIESNNIKHLAFSELFKQFPEYYSDIMLYHYSHNQINRYEKFRHIMENILKQKYDSVQAQNWASKFSELTRERIINCPYVDGALDFIQIFSRKYPLYIASVTPFDELMIILRERRLNKYFKDVYGAPMKKEAMFADIVEKEKVLWQNILFIGDSIEDYKVAEKSGIFFIARLSDNNFDGFNVQKFKNLHSIKSFLLKGVG